METTVRPIAHARDVSVLDGIVVNVIDVALEVGLVTDGVLPIAALPNSFVALGDFAQRPPSIAGKRPRKAAFDQVPTSRKICIVIWQRPDGVQMVWQNANRDGLERVPLFNGPVDLSQAIDVAYQEIA